MLSWIIRLPKTIHLQVLIQKQELRAIVFIEYRFWW